MVFDRQAVTAQLPHSKLATEALAPLDPVVAEAPLDPAAAEAAAEAEAPLEKDHQSARLSSVHPELLLESLVEEAAKVPSLPLARKLLRSPAEVSAEVADPTPQLPLLQLPWHQPQCQP